MSRRFLATLLAILALPAAGCSRAHSGGEAAPVRTLALGGGNGQGEEGLVVYAHLDALHPCADRDANGMPRPNSAFAVQVSRAAAPATLFRDACADLSPARALGPDEVTAAPDGSGTLYFRGDAYAPQAAALSLDFTATGALPAGFSVARASTATYFDAGGVLRTAAADTPRLDHDPVTRAARGLLVEPAATNLLARSEAFDDPAWFDYKVGIARAEAPAPDGTRAMSRITESTATGYHDFSQNVGVADDGIYTFSIYLRAAGRSRVWVQLQRRDGSYAIVAADLAAGTATGGGGIAAVGDGIFRAWVSDRFGSGATPAQVMLGLYDADGASQYAGDGTSGVYAWGAQLEAGAAPSSYIATAAGPATRAADQARMGVAGWFAPGAGSLLVESVNLTADATAAPVLALFSGSAPGPMLLDAGAPGAVSRAGIGFDASAFVPSFVAIGGAADGAARAREIRRVQYYPLRLPDSLLGAPSGGR